METTKLIYDRLPIPATAQQATEVIQQDWLIGDQNRNLGVVVGRILSSHNSESMSINTNNLFVLAI